MKHSTALPRRALRRSALALGAVGVALLAFAGVASANVITVNPDGTSGTDNLTAAINTANTNGQSSNTIVLNPGRYTPATTITITHNLTITGNHAAQAVTGAPATDVDASTQVSKAPGNLWTVPSGVTLTLEGFQLISGAGAGFADVDDAGTLTTWGMALTGGNGSAVTVEAGASATLNETQINGCTQNGVINRGTLDLEHSDVLQCGQAGIDNGAGTTTTLNNSILTAQVGAECITAVQSTTASLDDDASCGVAHSGDLSLDSDTLTPAANGGPTLSVQFPAGSSVTGDAASCPTVDERFFVNAGTCDIGAESASATRDTTPPTCAVTNLIIGPPKAQQVTVQDLGGSGMGPEPGLATDNPTNAPPTTQPTSAVPVFGYGVSNLFINNGSFSWTPPTAPTTSGVVLTATKTDQTMLTHWNFTAMDWAGNSTFCN